MTESVETVGVLTKAVSLALQRLSGGVIRTARHSCKDQGLGGGQHEEPWNQTEQK